MSPARWTSPTPKALPQALFPAPAPLDRTGRVPGRARAAAGGNALKVALQPFRRGLAPGAACKREFLDAFREFEALEIANRLRLSDLAGDPRQDERIAEEVLRTEPCWHAATDALGRHTEALSPDGAEQCMAFVRGSKVATLLREAPFFSQILGRPRGYPGDAEMMRFIYRAVLEGKTPFGRFWHLRSVCAPGARAVRNRKALMLEKILARPGARVLSLAAGPAEEIRSALQRSSSDYSFLALDHDIQTLRELEEIRDPRFRAALANAFRMIAGDDRIAIPRPLGARRANPAKDFKSWRRLLVPFLYRFERLPARAFDLVYSAGLFDYIRPSPEGLEDKAQALTRFLFDRVAPGGELVIGNFNPSFPRWNRFCMDYLADWQLVYRTDEALREFAAGIDPREIEGLEIVREAEGINSFLVLRKHGRR